MTNLLSIESGEAAHGQLQLTPTITEPMPSFRPGVAVLSLFAAVMPLIFAATFFDPYIGPKQLLLTGGAALLLFLWTLSTCDVPVTSLWGPISAMATLGAISL